MKTYKNIGGFATILLFLCLLLTGCYSDSYDVDETSALKGNTQVVLTFVTPNNSSTRSATDDPDGYETGIGYEDDINISGSDYKMYFFTYESGDENGGELIAEFKPESIKSSSTSSTTTYIVTGDVPEDLKNVSNFRVVMLANWGSYPSVTVGTTTIDDLCEGTNTTYSASNKFTLNESNLIPFYGVQEYSGVTFMEGTTTSLDDPVSLLRAVAKVEVILTKDSYVDAFEAVSLVNYNAEGYCAPAGVYTAEDYDTEMKNNPSSGNWSDEWVKELHLVNGKNDTDSKTQPFTKINGATQDTWRIYVPEYDNVSSTDDYSYITVTINDEEYNIYFAEYDVDGETDNTDTSNRYNIKRNNLYRFYVTYKHNHITVSVEEWENAFDNEWTFGTTVETGEVLPDGTRFQVDYIEYEVTNSENREVMVTYVTEEEGVQTQYFGTIEIPEIVRYDGVGYTVTAIGEESFYQGEGITSVSIPQTVTNIGTLAFYDCSGMVSITCYNPEPPTCEEDVFSEADIETCILYVPSESVSTYQSTSPWSSFTNIQAITDTEP